MSGQRVLIDGYYLGKPSGYGRFVGELCRALGKTDAGFEFLVAVHRSVDERLLEPRGGLDYVRMPRMTFPLWEQLAIPLCALRYRCSLVHFPYNTRALLTAGRRSVTTVHDLIFLQPDAERDFKSRLIHTYMSAAFHMATVRSDCVVAVSDTTRDALAAMGVTSTRVYNTVDGFIETAGANASPPSPRPYFLHRGSYASGHRNTERIIQAFLSRPELTNAFDLTLLGVPDGAELWKTTPDQPVHYLPRVSDEELASLYTHSAGVVAASLLEGFCLPIIEAFGFGAPAIASNIDPMREIAGDAALLVSPYDVDEMARAMAKIASDGALAKDLIERGRRRLQDFSAERMAAELIDLYRSALSRDRNGRRTSPAERTMSAR